MRPDADGTHPPRPSPGDDYELILSFRDSGRNQVDVRRHRQNGRFRIIGGFSQTAVELDAESARQVAEKIIARTADTADQQDDNDKKP